MAPRKKPRKVSAPKHEQAYAAIVNTTTGRVALVESGTSLFHEVKSLLAPAWAERAAAGHGSRRMDAVPSSPFQRGAGRLNVSAYQWLTGTVLPSLRQRLLPDDDDLAEIVQRVDFYRKHIPWVNRGLVIRAGLNASEFHIDSPGMKEQAEWMRDLSRRLRMFSFMREFFIELRAYGQVIPLWRTKRGGRDPISIECANPQVYQPRFNPADGSRPRIVAIPKNDEALRRIAEESRTGDPAKRARAAERLKEYPEPIRRAVEDVNSFNRGVEVEASDLEKYGFNFEYATLDRRHWEDWGFPGMYSIFPYLEMLMLADDADVNALHHYKAGILLVRLGPSEPKAGDEALIASELELKSIDKKLAEMVKARLPGWAARGDLRIDWVVPPEHIMNPQKVASAKEKVLDWLGLPRIAWAGQDIQGAFASAQVSLKFLQQESIDERGIARELFEEWFFERASASNKFQGKVWPDVRFDPNALLEPRIILELARLYMQLGGADEQTIAEMFGYNAETWLAQRAQLKKLQKQYKVDFSPEYVPPRGGQSSGRSEGRPTTVDQPTPERGGQQQPRPSVEQASEVAERVFGISRQEFEDALKAEVVASE